MLQDPNPEQKLNYIYETLRDMESRRKRHAFYRFLKWVIIAWLAYLVATNPSAILTPIMNYVKPIVMEQAKSIMEENKKNFMESMKDMIPDNIISVPVSETKTSTTTKTSTKK